MISTLIFNYILTVRLYCCLYSIEYWTVPFTNYLWILHTVHSLTHSKSCGYNIHFHRGRRSSLVFKVFMVWRLCMFLLCYKAYCTVFIFDTSAQQRSVAAPNMTPIPEFALYECFWDLFDHPPSTITVIDGTFWWYSLFFIASCFSSCLVCSISSPRLALKWF